MSKSIIPQAVLMAIGTLLTGFIFLVYNIPDELDIQNVVENEIYSSFRPLVIGPTGFMIDLLHLAWEIRYLLEIIIGIIALFGALMVVLRWVVNQ